MQPWHFFQNTDPNSSTAVCVYIYIHSYNNSKSEKFPCVVTSDACIIFSMYKFLFIFNALKKDATGNIGKLITNLC